MAICLVEILKDTVDNPSLPIFEPLEKIEVTSYNNKFIDGTNGTIWTGSNNGHFVSSEIPVNEGDELLINNELTYIPSAHYCGMAFYSKSVPEISNSQALNEAFLGSLERVFRYGEKIKYSDMPEGTKYIRIASNVEKQGSEAQTFNVFKVIKFV